jgi:hypothetical protein
MNHPILPRGGESSRALGVHLALGVENLQVTGWATIAINRLELPYLTAYAGHVVCFRAAIAQVFEIVRMPLTSRGITPADAFRVVIVHTFSFLEVLGEGNAYFLFLATDAQVNGSVIFRAVHVVFYVTLVEGQAEPPE